MQIKRLFFATIGVVLILIAVFAWKYLEWYMNLILFGLGSLLFQFAINKGGNDNNDNNKQ